MRAEENGAAAFASLGHAAPELALHQRIETAGGLVGHEQRRPGRERSDQRDLLPVARGVGPARLVEVELEPVDERAAIVMSVPGPTWASSSRVSAPVRDGHSTTSAGT
jgi:hypothetical protein